MKSSTFGNAGNNTGDEVAALRNILLTVRPDFVVLQWFVNDVELPPPSIRPSALPLTRRSLANRVRTRMRNVSALYFLSAGMWYGVLDGLGTGSVDDMHRRFGDPTSSKSRRAEAALLEFFRTSHDGGVSVGLVLVPHLAAWDEGNSHFALLHDRIAALCRCEQIPFVDLREAFTPYMRASSRMALWVSRVDPYMGPFANRVAASRIFDAFASSWMRPTAASGAQVR